jgi:hypothetical protein
MHKPDMWMRLRDVNTKVDCTPGSKLIDSSDWTKSMILIKTQQAMPTCPTGFAPGTVQPPPAELQAIDVKVPPLDATEKQCIVEFIKAAAGR